MTGPIETASATGFQSSVPRSDGHKVMQITSDMIASNISPDERVAPALAAMSVIDHIYEFADKLQAGSTLGGKPSV